MTMTLHEIIAEMRDRVATSSYVIPVASAERWADALERAMREPLAIIEVDGDINGATTLKFLRAAHLESDTLLYTLPPDAARLINEQMAEIEQLKTFNSVEIERLRQGNRALRIERDEARKLVSELSNECGAEIERLRSLLRGWMEDTYIGPVGGDLLAETEELLKKK